MDAKQFDRVVKAVGAGRSRRRVLAGLLGAVLTGALGQSAGSAKRKRQDQRRHRPLAQRGGNDNSQGNNNNQGDTRKPDGATCARDGQCRSGKCCTASPTDRQGICTVLGTVTNCLACGNRCAAPQCYEPVCDVTGCGQTEAPGGTPCVNRSGPGVCGLGTCFPIYATPPYAG